MTGGGLQAGAAKVDITPPTGFRTDGWATNDRAVGTLTRLYARALVLQSGGRKIALVTLDLVGATGGLVKEAALLDKDLGFSESNVLVSGTHTHSGAGQFSNFGELNAGFPAEKQLINDPKKFFDFALGGGPDVQEYTFMVHRLALAIRLADQNLGPALAGWSDQRLLGVTQNRSLEAHLANFGLNIPNHEGKVSQNPGGYADTIDPALPVLRVDKLVTRAGHPCVSRSGRGPTSPTTARSSSTPSPPTAVTIRRSPSGCSRRRCGGPVTSRLARPWSMPSRTGRRATCPPG